MGSPEQALLDILIDAIREFQAQKPTDRSEMARRYAITITELEKAAAYFAAFCVNDIMPSEV